MDSTADFQSRTEQLRHKPIPKLLWQYALPAVAGTIVNALYNIIDSVFIGRGVDENAIAGVGITFPITMFLQGFGMMVGAGAAVRISILLGQKNYRGADRVLGNAVYLSAILSVLSIVPCIIFMRPLLELFGASGPVMEYAVQYLSVLLPLNFLSSVGFGYNNMMRASGYPKKAMITMFIAAPLNALFDYIFIFIFDWGIAGAAWATNLAMFISLVFVMVHFFQKKSLVHFRRDCMKVSWSTMTSVMAIGMAPFFVQIVGSVVSILMNRNFVSFAPTEQLGHAAIASYTIVNSYATLIIMFVIGVSHGMQPIVGYNFGAMQMKRVRECFNLVIVVNTAATVLGSAVALLWPQSILRIYGISEETMQVGVKAFRWIFLGFSIVGFQVTVTQFFQSLGYSLKSLFLSLTRQIIFLIPCLYIFPHLYGFSGVWMATPTADIASFITALGMITYQFTRVFPKKFRELAKGNDAPTASEAEPLTLSPVQASPAGEPNPPAETD